MGQDYMINESQARSIVSNILGNLEDQGGYPPLVLIDEHTERHDFGWVFYWESVRYFETGDVNDMLVGNFPFIVLRADGTFLQVEGGRPLQEQLAELKQALGLDTAAQRTISTSASKKKKRFSMRSVSMFAAVIVSALVVVQLGIETASYLAIGYFLCAMGVIYLKAKISPKQINSSPSQRPQEPGSLNQNASS